MRGKGWIVAFSLLLLAVVVAGGLTVSAKPGTGKGFRACPFPPCQAPCEYPPQPEVVCKNGDGPPFVTSFACCCCGSAGNDYKPL